MTTKLGNPNKVCMVTLGCQEMSFEYIYLPYVKVFNYTVIVLII